MTKTEKEAFKKRMAAGRRKAARNRGEANPKKRKPVKKAAKKKAAKKKPNPNARKSKKAIAKGFGRQLAAEHVRGKKKAAKARKAGKHNPGRRRNQDDGSIEAAAERFESFHGKAPGRVIEYSQELRYSEHFAELGKLIELRFYLDAANPDFSLTKFGACQVVSTPDGANIYFIGGDQSVDLAAMDIGSDKDFVELGPCTYISYLTIKGFHDFEPTTYWHQFGEEDGIFPSLVYDRLNKGLFLTSGNYRVRPEGIVN